MEKKQLDLDEKLNILRAGVLGANDGIVSVAGVVIGVAAANSSWLAICIAGLAAVLAGAFSMSGGEYVSVSTQADTEKAAIEHQKLRLEHHFEEEKELVSTYYENQGISKEIAKNIAEDLMNKTPLETSVHIKYNLEVGEYTNPWHAAFSSFVAFVLGSLLPMVAILVSPSSVRIFVTAISVTIALFITGYVSASLGDSPKRPAIIRNVVVGVLTMVVTYMIGLLIHA